MHVDILTPVHPPDSYRNHIPPNSAFAVSWVQAGFPSRSTCRIRYASHRVLLPLSLNGASLTVRFKASSPFIRSLQATRNLFQRSQNTRFWRVLLLETNSVYLPSQKNEVAYPSNLGCAVDPAPLVWAARRVLQVSSFLVWGGEGRRIRSAGRPTRTIISGSVHRQSETQYNNGQCLSVGTPNLHVQPKMNANLPCLALLEDRLAVRLPHALTYPMRSSSGTLHLHFKFTHATNRHG